MIYPENFEQRIGFDRIREQIVEMCSTASAREVIAAEGFLSSRQKIAERLELADEMRQVISFEPGAEIGEGEELRPIVDKIAVEGSYLLAEECAALLKAMRSAATIVGFITSRREGSYPRLKTLTRGVEIFPELQGFRLF